MNIGKIISQNCDTSIWDDKVIVISKEDLTIEPIVLEPIEVDFNLLTNNNYEDKRK